MKKILTLIIDGFGIRDEIEGNAIKAAKMPNYEQLISKYPNTTLFASGPEVGLPTGQAGNEVVGYETISAGQIIKQKSSYVHDFVDEDNLRTNTPLKNAIDHAKKNRSTIHIIGLMSDGGINSNIEDTIKIINYLKTQEIKIAIDFIADGKDVEPKSALKYIEMLEETGVPIVTVCGRYYALDNENKWDRTKIYYDLIRNGSGLKVKELPLALKNCYIRNITDEFLPPILVEPDKNIKDNDIILWVNYNEEGATQILTSLTNPNEVSEFATKPLVNTKVYLMYPVSSNINATVLINEEDFTTNNLGLYLSKLEITQARIAAQSSYECVTTYFNGGHNKKLPKCNTYLIESSEKNRKEESDLVTKQIIKCMEKDIDFILASIDTVDETGHTGNFENTVEILEYVDECLGKIIESAELNFYTIFILSAHGNVENMIGEENKALTTHTNNKVPFIITDPKLKLSEGSLTSVAPTILSYMDISIPESMKSSKILFKD